MTLKAFHKEALGMETRNGSTINQVIGMGVRQDMRSGKFLPVVDFYQSHLKKVIKSFELFPIVKHFGINVEEAMNLPVDRWYHIQNAAMKLAEKEEPSMEEKLIQLIKELVIRRGDE